MVDIRVFISYSIAVFVVVFLTGFILNFLKYHFIFQLAGIAFFFIILVLRIMALLVKSADIDARVLCLNFLPIFSGVSACLINLVLGFWIFPGIRKKVSR